MSRPIVSIIVDGIERDDPSWHGYIRLRVKCLKDNGATQYTVENHVPATMSIADAVKLSLRRFHHELADMNTQEWFK